MNAENVALVWTMDVVHCNTIVEFLLLLIAEVSQAIPLLKRKTEQPFEITENNHIH